MLSASWPANVAGDVARDVPPAEVELLELRAAVRDELAEGLPLELYKQFDCFFAVQEATHRNKKKLFKAAAGSEAKTSRKSTNI